MLRSFFVVAAFFARLASGEGLVIEEASDLATMLEQEVQVHQHFSDVFGEHLPAELRAEFHARPKKADDHGAGCRKCVGGGAKWLVGKAKDKIDAACKKEVTMEEFEKCEGKKDCKKKMWCKFWHDKPDMALGLVIENLRPVTDAMFYCVGHGECKKEDTVADVMKPILGEKQSAFEELGFAAETTVSDELKELDPADALYDHKHEFGAHHGPREDEAFDGEERRRPSLWRRIKNWFRSWFHGPEEDEDDEDYSGSSEESEERGMRMRGHFFGAHMKPHGLLGHPDDKHDGMLVPQLDGVDKRCYMRVTKFVMGMAVKNTVKMCKTTKCPYLKGWCKWAGEHKEMAFGVILGKVEPWKYAIGRCWHKDGVMEHGGHHGHHKHHGHHGHHHHPCHPKRKPGPKGRPGRKPKPHPKHHGHHGHHHGPHHHGGDDGPDGRPDERPDQHPDDWEPVPDELIAKWEEKVGMYESFKQGDESKTIVDTYKFWYKKSEHKQHKKSTFFTLGDKSGTNMFRVHKDGKLVHLKWPKIFASLDEQGCMLWSHGFTSCPKNTDIDQSEKNVEVEVPEPVMFV